MDSLWLSNNQKKENIQIDNNYVADVCIIGAGICGLSTAYYLAKHGLKVIVLDKNGVGEKTSGHTTAKITVQHGLIYDYLINSFGLDFASKYYNANADAIANIKKIVTDELIDCDFEYQPNYIYTTKQENLKKIKNEVKAVNLLSKESTFVSDCNLPFKIAGAIKTEKQAQFHPIKYLYGLYNAIIKNGGLVFTNSLVYDVKQYENGYISYSNKYKVKSKFVVIASHYPFINFPGFYFSKIYQSTSYAIAIETNKRLFDGMYINTGEPVYSFRTAKYGDKKILIISGGDHKTGFSPESNSNYGYALIENEAKKLYPDYNILYKWNTRDCITLDKIPYVGEYSSLMPNMYVATGFNKWGMTSSNVAANIICDSILGKKNKYAEVFNSKRLQPIKNRTEVKNMINQVFHSFVSNRIKIPTENLESLEQISSIENDNGGIIRINGTAVGIYKNSEGQIFAVNPTCTHLGCLLTWNNLDKTWDCPCHGSRFDFTGKNLYDPAFKDLETFGENSFNDEGKK